MRAGGKMIMTMALIIIISSEMIGIGKQIHPTDNRGPISDNLQESLEAIRYHITTRFWVLTGNVIVIQLSRTHSTCLIWTNHILMWFHKFVVHESKLITGLKLFLIFRHIYSRFNWRAVSHWDLKLSSEKSCETTKLLWKWHLQIWPENVLPIFFSSILVL